MERQRGSKCACFTVYVVLLNALHLNSANTQVHDHASTNAPAAIAESRHARGLHTESTLKASTPGKSGLPQHSLSMSQFSQLDLSFSSHTRALRIPAFTGLYGYAAVANLSIYRSSILEANLEHFARDGQVQDADLKYKRFDLFQPVVQCPPGRPMATYGGNGDPQSDGTKFMCSMNSMQAPCVVYSLGSNGDVSFEKDVLSQTPCEVHTFDCTIDKVSILDAKRHFFHKLCIGKPRPSTESFQSLHTIMRRLNHIKLSMLKMDIEGSEFEALAEFKEHWHGLPEQIALEVHFGPGGVFPVTVAKNVPQMSLLISHLANLGYAIVSRDDNMIGNIGCCSELTFLKVEVRLPVDIFA